MNERPVILIVDDEKNTREGLQKSFRHKYDILLADSAEQGLEALRGHAVDVILVDLRMPGMDGMAFLRRVTASENPPLVILFTAYGTLQIADEALRQGAYEYLA